MSQEISQEKSENFEQQRSTEMKYFVGNNSNTTEIRSGQLPKPTDGSNKQLQVVQSEATNKHEIKVIAKIHSNNPILKALEKQLNQQIYFQDQCVYQLISNVRAALQRMPWIQDYNLLIQPTNEKADIPKISTQQKELTKENIQQFFYDMNQNKQDITKIESPMKNFLCTLFLDLFPKKTITQNDKIELTINVIESQQ